MLPAPEREGIGLTITLADITEEEFRVMELIEAERQEPDEEPGQGRDVAAGCRLTRVLYQIDAAVVANELHRCEYRCCRLVWNATPFLEAGTLF